MKQSTKICIVALALICFIGGFAIGLGVSEEGNFFSEPQSIDLESYELELTVEELENKPDTNQMDSCVQDISSIFAVMQWCFNHNYFINFSSLINESLENLMWLYAKSQEFEAWYLWAYKGVPLCTSDVFYYTYKCDDLKIRFQNYVNLYNRLHQLELIEVG
jgi:hypothetical protein